MDVVRFSVVVPTFNRSDTLRQTLAALVGQDYPDYEVIVVDDGSTDDTGEMVRQAFPGVHYLHQSNRGPAAARNAGIHAASGEIIAFTDDDCLPPYNWLTRLADGYARHPEVVGVGGYLEAPAEVLQHNILARYERYMTREHYGARDEEVVGGFECPAGGTCNMSYWRSVLIEVGGFDEGFRYAAGEDTDLKWRICRTGAQLLYMPIKVTHLQPYTFGSFRRQQIIRGRGAAHFERKHFGHAPSVARIVLRLAKRTVRFAGQVMGGHNYKLACVQLAAGWFDCWGQFLEIMCGRK
ncbi:MAG: glycosyl transferase [Ardenticatenia bacterium]|jgi:glycosyltransferase involved in cell wall biosynthesis|nr:MAG: glycosyl transferase [Ardenticatenia bacterium]